MARMLKTVLLQDHATGNLVFGKQELKPAWFTEDGYLFWKRRVSSRTFNHVEYPEGLTDGQGFAFCKLVKKFVSEGNRLSVCDDGIDRYLTLDDMAEFWGVQVKQARRNLDVYLKLDMLAVEDFRTSKKKETCYLVNPIYQMYNDRLSYGLYRKFKESLDKYLSSNAIHEFERRIKE